MSNTNQIEQFLIDISAYKYIINIGYDSEN